MKIGEKVREVKEAVKLCSHYLKISYGNFTKIIILVLIKNSLLKINKFSQKVRKYIALQKQND